MMRRHRQLRELLRRMHCSIAAMESNQPISQTLAKVDPSTISDEELAAIAMNGTSVNAQAH
jgi:hypothetical protein